MNLQFNPSLSAAVAVTSVLSPLPDVKNDLPIGGAGIGVEETSSCATEFASHSLPATFSDFPSFMDMDGEGSKLHLNETPRFILHDFKEIQIEGWGIRMGCGEFDSERATREMARQFIRLHQTLKREGTLSPEDRKIWTFIGKQIDYTRYCEENSAPVFCQGIKLGNKNGTVTLRWLDGSVNTVSGSFAERMKNVNDGESFTCKAKFVKTKLVELSQVEPLFLPEVVDTSWIQPYKPTI